MTTKNYTFESANKGEIYITIDGEYEYGTKDVSIDVNGEDGTMIEDTDDAADVINWLIDNGVRFESKRSMFANLRYIQSVLIDSDMTPEQIWDEVAAVKFDDHLVDLLNDYGVEKTDVTDDEPKDAFETITKGFFGFADWCFEGNQLKALSRYYGAMTARNTVIDALNKFNKREDEDERKFLFEELHEIDNYREALDYLWGEREEANGGRLPYTLDSYMVSAEDLLEVMYPVED